MLVHGVDMTLEAYRISAVVDGIEIKGFLPEGLVMETRGLDRRPGHGEVYAWLDDNNRAVLTALKTRMTGGVPNAPFDRIDIAEEF